MSKTKHMRDIIRYIPEGEPDINKLKGFDEAYRKYINGTRYIHMKNYNKEWSRQQLQLKQEILIDELEKLQLDYPEIYNILVLKEKSLSTYEVLFLVYKEKMLDIIGGLERR